MRIGQLASETGVSVQTIRFYERRGLLKKTRRLASGYRSYSTDAIRQIRFIKNAQDLGYTLAEIAQLLRLNQTRPHNVTQARTIVEGKIRQIEDRINKLQQMRKELIALARACGCGDAQPVCLVLEQLESRVEEA